MATAFALTNAQAALFAAAQQSSAQYSTSITTNRAKAYLKWLDENESDKTKSAQL